ncbi:MAG TPA: MgtC/SapB family protein [Thermoflexales bacterium]|nr:MgtC/SapB family protein [Thermoflexales bacterium]HQW35159.1 MgtC/SapB family protein [Thermoflexales bacterium]HQX75855.1 MgtC/SapB family protein [Thermoflexales bacterium]HQZ23458.1 MgtC/SapB family protein [Thermoflexales bacterium]HRA00888.1 MgtC/SapB family protein [Thermoflexales bacterium]
MTLTSPYEYIFRILASLIAGSIIGVERESHGRAAGLRTTILVCLAACLAMLISESVFIIVAGDGSSATRPDPMRLSAGVLSGMGFLGAGAIIRNGIRVNGLTTAATLWYVTMLGLAFGSGLYLVGALGLLSALIILIVLPRLESRVKNDWYATVTVIAGIDGASDEVLHRAMEVQGVKIKRVELDYNIAKGKKILRCELKFKREEDYTNLSERVVRSVMNCDGVLRVAWA